MHPDLETQRLQKLYEYRILDTSPEQAFNDVVLLAAQLCNVPMALISFVDADREWIKAKRGVSINENARENGFCTQTILQQDVLIIADVAEVVGFATNVLVQGEPKIRFYAGATIRAPSGEALGAISVLDRMPRNLSANEINSLRILARQVTNILELKRKEMFLAEVRTYAKESDEKLRIALAEHEEILNRASVSIITTNKQGIIKIFNRAAQQMLGYHAHEVIDKHTPLLFHDATEINLRAHELSDELQKCVAPGFETFIAKLYPGQADKREWTYVRKDGSRFPVCLFVTTLYGPGGDIRGFLKIAFDLTDRIKAENKIQRSERFTQAVLDALSKQFCVLDAQGDIVDVNKRWLEFEQSQDIDGPRSHVGQNLLQLLENGKLEGRGGAAFAQGIRDVVSGKQDNFTLEYCHLFANGPQWFVGRVMPFPDPELGSVIVTDENISEHKLLELRFRQAVEFAPNAIVMVDLTGTIVLVNRQTELSFGYSRQELIGQSASILVPERFRLKHQESMRKYLTEPRSRLVGEGQALFGRRKDNTEFPVEIALNFIKSQKDTLVLSTVIDITKRKQLEKRFRKAVDSAPNAMVMIDASGSLLMINRQGEKMFGYSRQDLIGKPIEVLIPERFRNNHARFREAYFSWPQSRPMGMGRELYGLRQDGSEFPVEIGLGFIDDDNGTLVLGSVIDITERKNASDNLKQALHEKEMLLKEVYHRVKNNLQVVSSLVNLQASNIRNSETVDLLKQSANRIKSIALLHEKLYQSDDLTRVDFNAYIRSLVDYLLFGYDDRSDRITINIDIDHVFLDVDTAIPCGLIINELLSNALIHAFPGTLDGSIGISFKHNQQAFVLEIKDNGVGIPPGIDFKQSHSLGLQLVNTLTNQLMGTMTLDQTCGTRFTLCFTYSN